METKRAFLAILLSVGILFGYQYFFAPSSSLRQDVPEKEVSAPTTPETPAGQEKAVQPTTDLQPASGAPSASVREGKIIPVETSFFTAQVSETGGGIKSFKLKKYLETLKPDSDFEELITTRGGTELPLYFTWGASQDSSATVPVFTADKERLDISANGEGTLSMSAMLPSGIRVNRILTFRDKDYRMRLVVEVDNPTSQPLQGAPHLRLTNRPFSSQHGSSRYLFTGPSVFVDGALQEIKSKDLEKSAKTVSGNISWTAYEDTYFMCGVIPLETQQNIARYSLAGDDQVSIDLSGNADIIPPHGRKQYQYTVYFGPKELATLKAVGSNLDRIVDFGWFDVMAKPTLYLLNFLHKYIHNFGVAIILVTIIIKLLFWPIAQKGMKSMKVMQKLQPKMAKLREKYKDDKERLNQEIMKLYQTYKVNPIGGCLPMVLQIPVFFALYKVLLQTIELRHAPFMLWINDLSAPDRLYIGFHLPYVGGLPVLTLLMGASMYLQQKMTPTTGDPTQAKMMKFLPLIFTFMFINFASGLVLYWFVNNLLSIAQQYMINRQVD